METLWVQFKINDIRLPEPAKVLQKLHGQDSLRGRIIDFCGSDAESGRFALLEVVGFSEAVVVPVTKLVSASEFESASNAVNADSECRGTLNLPPTK